MKSQVENLTPPPVNPRLAQGCKSIQIELQGHEAGIAAFSESQHVWTLLDARNLHDLPTWGLRALAAGIQALSQA